VERPLLSAHEAEKFDHEAAKAAFRKVLTTVIKRIPGNNGRSRRKGATR